MNRADMLGKQTFMIQYRSLRRALFAASVLALLACSSSSGGNRMAEAQGGNNNAAGNGSGSGGASNNASGGTSVIGFSGSTGMPGGGSGGALCAATSVSAKLVPLDLYVLMDSSKSMNELTSVGATKWKATTDALKAFFADAKSEGLSVALKFFPDEQPIKATCSSNDDCGSFGPCDQRKACVAKGKFTKDISSEILCSADTDCKGTDEICAPVQRCSGCKDYCVSGGGAGTCPQGCTEFTGYCRERDVCTPATYATPVVPFSALPAMASTLSSALDARMPDGFTPTGPALTGAIQQAREHAKANPSHKVAVVLVTDGLPGGFDPRNPPASCMPGTIDGVVGVARDGYALKDNVSIPTFVIGVFGPCDLGDQNVMPEANLNKIAGEGGTKKAVIVNTDQNVQQQIQDALKLARTSVIACQYEMPKSDTGTVNPKEVNVKFTSASTGEKSVYFVLEKGKCDASKGGWYYDTDPDKAPPTQIILCDQSCSTFQSIQDGRVDIALGCKTEVPL